MSTAEHTRPAPNTGLQNIGLALIGTVLCLSAVVWVTGQLAGRLASGRWPQVAFSDMPRVLGRLAHHTSDPAAAWPAPQGRLLPGPVGFYATLALVLSLLGGLGVLAFRLWKPRDRMRATMPDTAGARWARLPDLKDLLAREPQPGRLTLGTFANRLVVGEERASLLVFGPTQTGKTTGLAIPAILEWQGPVVCTTVKSDLLRDTRHARTRRDGTVLVFDPTSATGAESNTWSPLAQAGTWWGAQQVADALVSVPQTGYGSKAVEDFWHGATTGLLAPLLHAAAVSGKTMSDVIRWVNTRDITQPEAALAALPDPGALELLRATMHDDTKTRANAYTTTRIALAAYQDPRVQHTSRSCEITAERLLDGGHHTLYLCAPSHEQARLRPLFVTLIEQITRACAEREQRTGRPLDPPLLLVLDEAANIAPLTELATLCSTAAGQGIQLVTVFQDLAQIHATYGHDKAKTITSNHRARLFLGASADPDTLEHASRLVGETQEEQTSTTVDAFGRNATTTGTRTRPLLPPDGLRRLPRDTAVLLYHALPAALVRLRPWYRER